MRPNTKFAALIDGQQAGGYELPERIVVAHTTWSR
jgi:hypothetical protein